MAEQSPIWVDCDPGVDDAIALLLAFGLDLPIAAISTVAGNVPLDLTYQNARKICLLAGREDVPVYRGCPRPLIKPLATAEDVHGKTGLQGADLPLPSGEDLTGHGVFELMNWLLNAPSPVRVAALGPLTNLAALLIQCPAAAEKIAELVVMGGAWGQGNITPSAEFNSYVDPHAAQIVFSAGIPTTLMTLDVTHQVLTTPERLAAIRAVGNPVATAAAGMLEFYGRRDSALYDMPGGPLHDPCVLAYLHDPSLFTTQTVSINVETTGEHTAGRTVIDLHSQQAPDGSDSTVQVGMTANADGIYALLNDALKHLENRT